MITLLYDMYKFVKQCIIPQRPSGDRCGISDNIFVRVTK